MTTFELLAQLRSLDVKLWVEGEKLDKLRYRAPKGALGPELLARLAERKAEVLELLRQSAVTAVQPMLPVPRGGDLPLSFPQERLWFIDQWEPGGFAYNIPQAVRLTGRLDDAALERSLEEIVRRHEALRTTFPAREGKPSQVIHPPAPLSLPRVDLSALPPAAREAESQKLAVEDARSPFDLARGPLLRAFLLRLSSGSGETDDILLLNLHHIISDGWSTGVLLAELAALYPAFAAGKPSPLPPLPIQYADFAVWQRERLRGASLEELLGYWRERLRGAPGLLELPADRPRPPVQSFRGELLPFHLPAPLTTAVRALCQKEGSTLFMALLAAWSTLLARHSGQPDIVVGSPIANRNRAEIEGLIGFFVNTLVLRTDVSAARGFRGLLEQVREVTLGAYGHQDLPFEKLVEELRPERDPSHSPVFQVMFVLQNTPMPAMALPGLTLTPVPLDSGTSKFDLNLLVTDSEPELECWLEINTDLFDRSTAERWIGHYRNLLEALVQDPEQDVLAPPLLGEAERRQVVEGWNDTAVTYPPRHLNDLFEVQAARTPDLVAVELEGVAWTYAELNARANRLARHLRRLGVGTDALVAISVERSLEMVTAVLGVLKAGAAIVPLDAAYPQPRLAFMLEDSGAPVLLTQERLLDRFPDHRDRALCLDDLDGEDFSDLDDSNLGLEIPADCLIYVIYTSGSTGQPKGVALQRGVILNLIEWQLRLSPPPAGARTLQFSPLSFDASFHEMFSAWGSGGTIVLIDETTRRDPAGFLAYLTRHSIGRLFLPFVALQQLSEAAMEVTDPAGLPRDLREVVTAGEQLQATDAVIDFFSRLPGCRLYNDYGPSETHVVTALALDETPGTWQRLPTIGSPIANSTTYVLDRSLAPVPVGIAGELYLGGLPLARGYHRRPGLTAERFIPDPFSATAGGRLYRTGDLARWQPDGQLRFLGRIDHQVKIRGFRIELGEVESLLAGHPGVREVAVVARDEQGRKVLAAYVVPQPGEAPTAADLRRFVKERAPEYMAPSYYVLLDAMPLSPAGKVDRRALPAPKAAASGSGADFVAPRTPVEELLASLWSELLKVEPIGTQDNFFDLGGHSLLATQVVSRIRGALGVDVPVRKLFEAPTIAGLARHVESLRAEGREQELPPILPVPRDRDLPLSFSQERLWLFEKLVPGTAAYNTYRAGRVRGAFDTTALRWTFDEMVRRHEALRTSFADTPNGSVQVIHPPAPLHVPLIDLEALPEERRDAEALRLAQEDAATPFDLGRAPMLRALILHYHDAEHVVILTMHHVVYDVWSGWVLFSELEALYRAFAAREPSPLPELAVQYADFAWWQRHHLEGEVLDSQLDYWRRQLAGAPAILDLPTDRPRPAVPTYQGSAATVAFADAVFEDLKALARREGMTLFMALLAGYYALLRRYSGQDDVAVGSPIANRTRTELEGLIGFFVNTLVLRGRMAADLSGRDLLRRTREIALEAFANQDLPFERLVEELGVERRRNVQPFFQAVFVYVANYPAMTRSLAGLDLTPITFFNGATHFDLTLFLAERLGRLQGLIEYSTDLFDQATMDRFAGHYETLVSALVASPEARLDELPLLRDTERVQILGDWNDTGVEYQRDGLVHRAFEAQAARRPGAVALTFEDLELTYGELEARANRLARHLRAAGVELETRVGICLERSPELIVGLLAILKAGGAYVPLEASYPAERLAFLLEDSRTPVLVTRRGLAGLLPPSDKGRGGGPAPRLVLIDEEAEAIAAHSPAPLSVPGSAENLAYVLYTSGSTGRPKGVEVVHRNILRLVQGATFADLGEDLAFLQMAPVSFDASTLEIWGPLLNGGRVVVLPPGTPSLAELGEALVRKRVNAAWITAGLFHQMVEEALPSLGGLRQLLAGGDVLSPPHVRRVLELGTGATLINGYGPTESTTFTCCHPMRRAEDVISPVPIGRPINNTRVYLLDRDGHPAPAGVPGELLVGGDGLARGYLGRPELTAERFVPDGTSGQSGERLYRTGDLARWRPDGTVEFLGRIDHQVKIRGFRIEPGEVEAALARHPGVADAAVVVRREGLDKRLVAWFVQAAGAPADPGEVRAFLQEHLPDYMVPSFVAAIDAMPLTPNAKVDRQALAAREVAGAADSLRDGYVAPRTPEEELLAEIWSDVLGLARRGLRVGVHDDFFALGGHSLLATQVISRVRRTFGVELALYRLFDTPTVAGVAAELAAARREVSAPPIEPIEATLRDRPLELSFAQERLWFLDRLAPGLAHYNIPVALRLTGRLSFAALVAAFEEVARRHESLRTTFAEVDGVPAQVIAPALDLVPPRIDLSALPREGREAEARRLAQEEALRPFDLRTGPVARVTLLALGAREHALLLTMHHIVSDGWSMGVLVREVAGLYQAFAAGRPSPLPPLPIQYADFAVWQRRWLEGGALAEQLGYWRERLAGAPAALELPTDRPRPPVESFRGANAPLHLPAGLVDDLRALGRREGATLFMLVLTAFEILLGRYSGEEDLVVGSPIANRGREETEGLIGFFVNTLALRADLSGEPTLRELLGRTRSTALGAYAHQDVPFERLVEELAPERMLGRSPLFQVMLALQNTPMPRFDLADLSIAPFPLEGGTAKFDLSLALEDGPGGVTGALEYSTDLFDAATARRLLGHLVTALSGMASGLERPVADLPLISEAERHQLLTEWNATGPAKVPGLRLHELFEEQAARTPARVALVVRGERLTYCELDARAERLARVLAGLGVGPESRVGLCADRTPALVAGMLAILKAGGAYVPLDPLYPQERLAFMLRDSGAEVILTEERWAGKLRAGVGRRVFLDRPEAAAVERPPIAGSPGNLAYVIYTSGSTGRPKGVAIEHRSAVAMVGCALAVYTPEDLRGVFAATSVCFDFSVFELYVTLSAGGTVILGENALALASLPEAGEVTMLNLVPSAAGELVRLRAVPPSVRTVNLGGEPLHRALADRLLELPGVRRVFNLYGPSEDTIYSTFLAVPAGSPLEPSIGRPVAGTQAYVVGPTLQPVPLGVPGELCVGGAGLARGYLGRPELTAERFVPDPFSPQLGGRLYRTGDLVRHRAGGEIEFLGRIDHQVKVRGFRIELGEVEAALLALPGVREAVVLAVDELGDRRLAAFLELDEGTAPADLQAPLQRHLPAYMVPAEFVVLEALPLTLNGKVDRKALARLAGTVRSLSADAASSASVAPRTPIEELVAGIWSEVLGVDRVGIHDDFFALGGHSLLATQVVARLRQTLGTDLPLRRLFELKTVAGLAAELEAGEAAEPIPPAPRDRPLALSFAQERLWFLDRLTPGLGHYNIPIALRLSGALDVPALAASLAEVVRRHETLRTTFAETGGRAVQVIAPAGVREPCLPLADLSGLSVEAATRESLRLAGEEAGRPFDLAAGPLLRAALLRTAQDDHALLLTLHHIVSDGWSMGVLVREVAVLYEAFAAGRLRPRAALPELPIQYADFAVWQRSWLEGGALAEQLAYWRERLAGAPAALELPTDRPRPPIESFRGATAPLHLPEGLVEDLRALGRREGATLFMLLLTAFDLVLSRYSGQEDLVVGSPIANRGRVETEGLIGFFVNTLALRADLSGGPALREALGRVRSAALGAYAHQDVPFERLVEELAPERMLGRSPVFQVMLALQNAPIPRLDLAGLAITPLPLAGDTAKFDLTLTLEDGPGGLHGGLEYSTDLFDATTAARLLEHLAAALSGMATGFDRPAADLPLIGEAERHQLLTEWNATGETSTSQCLHELFEEQVARAPERVALVAGAERLTYRELDERAERLARYLQDLGVGPEARVPICVDRTPALLTGLLAILKAGGAYVPLDPAYPEERLALMLGDSGARVVLTEERWAGKLPAPEAGQQRVLLDQAPSSTLTRFAGEGAARPGASASRASVIPGNLAYVIYTSGSTGRPKGVAIEHRSAAAFVRWALGVFSPEDLRAVFGSTSICFDVSIFELFVPLAAGGAVVLAENALALASPVAGPFDISLLSTVPSAAAELLRLGAVPPSVRTVNLGGEALRKALADRVLELPGVKRLFNVYGPSEDTTYSTVSEIPAGSPLEPAIGRPLTGTQAYVVDRGLRPVPLGVPGELYLGGEGLSRGYLGRPELTAERYVPNPFSERGGERLYRVGDLVRYRTTAELEFLGRIDHQVKVRGFRIELGEVEAALLAQSGVREAVVVAAEKRLIAYASLDDGTSTAQLQAALQQRLPVYMVPSDFVVLETLPHTPNGKVDRRALPAPGRAAQAGDIGGLVPPRTALELELVDLWEEVLGVRPLGVRDNFFRVGGHSLLAVRLMGRIEERFGRTLPLAELFRAGTVEDLAATLESEAAGSFSPRVALRASGSRPPFFCVHAIGGEVLGYRPLALHLGEDQPFHGLQARGLVPGEEPLDNIQEMARLYLQAVREVQPAGPYSLGGWSFGALVAYEMAWQLAEQGERCEALVLIDKPAPGSWSEEELDDAAILAVFAGETGLSLPLEELRGLEPEAALACVAGAAEEARLLPSGAGTDFLRRRLVLYKAHDRAARAYLPGPYAGRLTVLRAAESPSAALDPDLGWGAYAAGPLEAHTVAGDHFSVVREPHVQELARAVAAALAAVEVEEEVEV